ncbi:YebG family protein [Microbulbifer guangxiensis]|uniref:YebG family protein n=1 Tax=Microbulbifer guangxiensis TaxID=2904249 RepID=UPI001F3D9DDA|nr:YebG family protein [Microbulbifer guangxiensis]
MAVVAVWKCDRDGAMFDNKKDAEEHDKMLELAANITSLIERHVDGISEEVGEEIGLLLAKRRENLAKACKGKPEILLEEEEETSADDDRVTPLAANQ